MSKLAIVLGVAALAVLAQPVMAACAGANLVAQEPANEICLNGGCSYSYLDAAIGTNFQSAFWSAGFGDPAVMAGNDSGTNSGFDLIFSPSGTLGTVDFGSPYMYFNQFFTNWGAGGVDGCVNADGPTACTCFLVTTDGDNGIGYAALGSKQRDVNGDFKLAANLDMRPVPNPMILSSSRNGTGVDLMVTVPAPAPESLVLDPACSGGCINNATYRVFSIEVARNAPMPSSRDIGDWTPLSAGPTALGQNSMVSAACSGGDTDLYIGSVINFDSGFENANVSGNATPVQCGPTLAEPVEIERPGHRPADARPERGKQGRIR
jgi:hypothetical protein